MLELELNDGSILQADDRNARAVQFACLLLASTISAVVTVNVIRLSAAAYHVGVGVTPAWPRCLDKNRTGPAFVYSRSETE